MTHEPDLEENKEKIKNENLHSGKYRYVKRLGLSYWLTGHNIHQGSVRPKSTLRSALPIGARFIFIYQRQCSAEFQHPHQGSREQIESGDEHHCSLRMEKPQKPLKIV